MPMPTEYRDKLNAGGHIDRPDGSREYRRADDDDDPLTQARRLTKKERFTHEDSARVSALTRVAELEREIYRPTQDDRKAHVSAVERELHIDEKSYERAFRRMLRLGINGVEPIERELLNSKRTRWMAPENTAGIRIDSEHRAEGVGTGAAGGYLVSQEFMAKLEQALKLHSPMRSICQVVTTITGASMPWPTLNDSSVSGELLAENTGIAEAADMTFAATTFSTFKYSSKLVRISRELAEDSGVDFEQALAGIFAARLGRVQNPHFTTGTGSGQPQGIVPGAALGKTGLTSQTTSIIYDDFVDLLHSIDPLYRMSPNCAWMMNDATLKYARKIKDTAGQPLLAPATTPGTRDMILGFPAIVNNDVATMSASAKSVLFGDFSKYVVRDAVDAGIVRLSERWAEAGQVGFILFLRSDGRLLDAGTNPIKFFANSAT